MRRREAVTVVEASSSSSSFVSLDFWARARRPAKRSAFSGEVPLGSDSEAGGFWRLAKKSSRSFCLAASEAFLRGELRSSEV